MYKKIYIIGPVGSGKTTLSNKMSKLYNIKKYELDKIVWDDENGNIKRTDEEINKLFKNIIKKKKWLIEDIGRNKFVEGIKEADITYYINLPKLIIKAPINPKIPNFFNNLFAMFLISFIYYFLIYP